MKKQLLTIALAAISAMSFGQFTITSTSITYTGHSVPAGTSQGQFYMYQPNNNGGTVYDDAACSTALNGSSPNPVGGFASTVYDATAVQYPRPDGVIYYGGKIRRVYYGASCGPNDPSFGFFTGNSGGISTGTDVDLSSTANQKISFDYTSSAAMTLTLSLMDMNYTGKLNGGTTITLVGDSATHHVSLDFSSDVANGADMTNVRQVAFIYTSTTSSPNFGISLANIKVGSAVTGVAKASDVIAQSKVYPNPASETATLSLDLKANSNVRVVLNDLVGKEMKVIAEGNYSSINENFSIADLAKGMYIVTYVVNGAAVKTESLIVR